MKLITNFVVALVLVSGLIGCVKRPVNDPNTIKCPACGYEFELPDNR